MPRKPNILCEICQTPVYRRPNEGRFCSQACFGISCRKEKPCIICGDPILASLHKKTCSKECFIISAKSINRNYSTGRKKIEGPYGKYGSRSLRQWLIEDRGDECELCGYRVTGVLQAHHIVERSKGGGDEPENLLLICPNCHQEIHKGYRTLGMVPKSG